jgi:hypothetical protein
LILRVLVTICALKMVLRRRPSASQPSIFPRLQIRAVQRRWS